MSHPYQHQQQSAPPQYRDQTPRHHGGQRQGHNHMHGVVPGAGSSSSSGPHHYTNTHSLYGQPATMNTGPGPSPTSQAPIPQFPPPAQGPPQLSGPYGAPPLPMDNNVKSNQGSTMENEGGPKYLSPMEVARNFRNPDEDFRRPRKQLENILYLYRELRNAMSVEDDQFMNAGKPNPRLQAVLEAITSVITLLVSSPGEFAPEAKIGICSLLEFACLTRRRLLLQHGLPRTPSPEFGEERVPLLISALHPLLSDNDFAVCRRALQVSIRLIPHILHALSCASGGDIARRALRRIWHKIETMLDEFGRDSWNHIRSEFGTLPEDLIAELGKSKRSWEAGFGPELLKSLEHMLATAAQICTGTDPRDSLDPNYSISEDVGLISAASDTLSQIVESLVDPRGVESAEDYAPLIRLEHHSQRNIPSHIRKALIEGPGALGAENSSDQKMNLSESDKALLEREISIDRSGAKELEFLCPLVDWQTNFSPSTEKAERSYAAPVGSDQNLYNDMVNAFGPIPRSKGLSETEEKVEEDQEEAQFEKSQPEGAFTRIVTLRSFAMVDNSPLSAMKAHATLAVPSAMALTRSLELNPKDESNPQTESWGGVQIAEAILQREAVLTAVSMSVARVMTLRPRVIPYFLPPLLTLCSRLATAFSDAVLATATVDDGEDQPIRIAQRNAVAKLRAILALALTQVHTNHRRTLPYCLLTPLENGLRSLGVEGVGLARGASQQATAGPGGATGLPTALTPSASDEVMRNLMKWPPGHIVELVLLTSKNKILTTVKPGPTMTGVGQSAGLRALLKPLPEIAQPLTDDVPVTVPGETPATKTASLKPQLTPHLYEFVSRFVFDVVTPGTGATSLGAVATAAAAAALKARADAVNETLFHKALFLSPSSALGVARSALVRLLSDVQEDSVFAAGGRSVRNALLARLAGHPLPLGIRASSDDIEMTVKMLTEDPSAIFAPEKPLLDLPDFSRHWVQSESDSMKEVGVEETNEASGSTDTKYIETDAMSLEVHLPSLLACFKRVQETDQGASVSLASDLGMKRNRSPDADGNQHSEKAQDANVEAEELAKMLPMHPPLILGHPHILRPEALEGYISGRPAHRVDLALRWLNVVLQSEREALTKANPSLSVYGEAFAVGDVDAIQIEGAPSIDMSFTVDNAPLPADIAQNLSNDETALKKARQAMCDAQKLRRARVICRTTAASLDAAYAKVYNPSKEVFSEMSVTDQMAVAGAADIGLLLKCAGEMLTGIGGNAHETMGFEPETMENETNSSPVAASLDTLSLPGDPPIVHPPKHWSLVDAKQRADNNAESGAPMKAESNVKHVKLDPSIDSESVKSETFSEESTKGEIVKENNAETTPNQDQANEEDPDQFTWSNQPEYISQVFEHSQFDSVPLMTSPFEQYESVLLRLMSSYLKMAPNPTSDKLLTQLLLECPLITHSAFATIYAAVLTQASPTLPAQKAVSRVIIGLNLLKDIAQKRPACRRVALLLLLSVAAGTNCRFGGPTQAVRAGARTLIVDLYTSNEDIRKRIDKWLVRQLGYLVKPGVSPEVAKDTLLVDLPAAAAFAARVDTSAPNQAANASGLAIVEALRAESEKPIVSAFDVIEELRRRADQLTNEAKLAQIEADSQVAVLQKELEMLQQKVPEGQSVLTEGVKTTDDAREMAEGLGGVDELPMKQEPSLERQMSTSSAASSSTSLERIQTKIRFYTMKASRARAAKDKASSQLQDAERSAEASAVSGTLELMGALSTRRPTTWKQILALYAVGRAWISRSLTKLAPMWLSQMPFAGSRGTGAQGAALARDVASAFENAPVGAHRLVLYLLDLLTGVKPQTSTQTIQQGISSSDAAESAAIVSAGATEATAYLFSPPTRPLPVSFQVAAWKMYEKNGDDPRFLIPQLPVLTSEMLKEQLPRLLTLPAPLPEAVISRLLGMVPQPLKTSELLRYLHTPQACGGRLNHRTGELIADPQVLDTVAKAITQVLKHPTAADAVELSKVVSDLLSVKHVSPLTTRTVEQASALVPALSATIQSLRAQSRRRFGSSVARV